MNCHILCHIINYREFLSRKLIFAWLEVVTSVRLCPLSLTPSGSQPLFSRGIEQIGENNRLIDPMLP